METKFRKGDRVVAVNDCQEGAFFKGAKGIVHSVDNDGDVYVQFEGEDEVRLAFNSELAIERAYRLASGMTLREHYAGLALHGLLSDQKISDFDAAVRGAVYSADLLIQALNEKP